MQKYLSNTPFNVKCTDWYFYLKVALCKKASQLGVCNVCSILISVFWIFQPWPVWQQVSVELGKWDGQYDERWVGGYYKKSLGFTTQSYLQSVSPLLSVWPHLVAVLLCCCHIPGCCCLLLQQKAGCLAPGHCVHSLSSALHCGLSPDCGHTTHPAETGRPGQPAMSPHQAPDWNMQPSASHMQITWSGGCHQTHRAPPWSPSCPPGVRWPCSPAHWTGPGPGLAGPGWQQAGCADTDSRLCSVTHWRISVCKVRPRHAGGVCCLSPAPCPHDTWHEHITPEHDPSHNKDWACGPSRWRQLHEIPLSVWCRPGLYQHHNGCSFTSHYHQMYRDSARGRANQPGPEQSWVAGFYKTDWNWKLFVRFGRVKPGYLHV